jgi:dephospho-CoA kinase
MKIIGLVGGICSGKSTVARILQEKGAHIIDADKLGHEAYLPGTSCYFKVLSSFNLEMTECPIDRKALGSLVYADATKMHLLKSIVWPHIEDAIEMQLKLLKDNKNIKVVVLEAALMLEAGWEKFVDEIWMVEAPSHLSIERLMKRNGFTLDECEKCIHMQKSIAESRKVATVFINNNGCYENLKRQVDNIFLKHISYCCRQIK